MNLKDLNVENLVRSGVVLVVGLPVALSLGGLVNTTSDLARESSESQAEVVAQSLKNELTVPCIKYMVSKVDSKLEREAKTDIDEVLGGEVDYGNTCKWVL